MRRIVVGIAISAAISGGAVRAWRRNPRLGASFVNAVVNPALFRHDLAGTGASEIGSLEHVGRTSGIRRLTPVHPEATQTGFRVLVPLGMKSEWARNVLAAGHCRLQLHDRVFDLDEPAMVAAGDLDGLSWPVRRLMAALGLQYLTLRTFATEVGSLEPTGANVTVVPDAAEVVAG